MKVQFNTEINKVLKGFFKAFCATINEPMSDCLEEAMKDWLEKKKKEREAENVQ